MNLFRGGGYEEIDDIFWGVVTNLAILGVISIHFRAFLKKFRPRYRMGMFFGGSQNFFSFFFFFFGGGVGGWGMPDIPIFGGGG